MNYSHLKYASLLAAVALCACSSVPKDSGSQSPTQAAAPAPAPAPTKAADGRVVQKFSANDVDGEIIGTPAKNSKFAKLKIGMVRKEVEDLIGTPNDEHSYTSGKAWIPFYFGKDAYRFQTFYKKEGTLTYEGGGVTGTSMKLIRVSVDTTERGYAHDD